MRSFIALAGVVILGLHAADPLSAQLRFGAQLSLGDETDFGIGARITFGLDSVARGLEGIVSFDYFFPDESFNIFFLEDGESQQLFDITYFEINGNLAYHLAMPEGVKIAPYVGGGLNIARSSVVFDFLVAVDPPQRASISSSDTNFGLNALGGASFGSGQIRPFVELRLEFQGGEQFVISGGILF